MRTGHMGTLERPVRTEVETEGGRCLSSWRSDDKKTAGLHVNINPSGVERKCTIWVDILKTTGVAGIFFGNMFLSFLSE